MCIPSGPTCVTDRVQHTCSILVCHVKITCMTVVLLCRSHAGTHLACVYLCICSILYCVLSGHKEKKLASLDQIVADVKQQRERSQDHQSTTPEIALPYQHHFLTSAHHTPSLTHSVQSTSQWGAAAEDHRHSCNAAVTASAGIPLFSFDDDSDLDSPTGY